ncbi:Ger(x)C family spore germination protein [Paenibacillus sp. PL91]|uniref:Ger(x)C family spore germination protein n=1 Tax=Paenibacillus sp. PL91 TaxID=2729538 RepID=UPI00145F69D7|nr:Ger(x)C family spore germination protein [Paenibacillus sp. PL91]MBC9200272.1 Ger(x)C family spore germination protein [Paenibacillus sp. PL91]
MRLKPFAVLALVSFVILTGCGDQRILEKQGFVQSTSYDLLPDKEEQSDKNLLITIDIPKADPEGKMLRETLSTTAHTIKEAKINFAGQTELSIASGQLRNTLFGLKLAKAGIWEHIDNLNRDPAIAQTVKVVVVNGRAHNLLIKNYPQHPRTGQYIDRMLDKEAEDMNIPTVTIYDFTRDYFDDGIDPVAPIIKEGVKNISFDGIALFDEDRYVAKVVPEKSLIFSMLSKNFKSGEISMNLGKFANKKERLLFDSIISKRKIHVKHSKEKTFKIRINLDINGSIQEYSGILQISKDKDRKEIERLMAVYIVHEAETVIKLTQKYNVDSFGIGKYVRNSLSYEEWKSLNWQEVYPNVDVECTAKVVIKDFGKVK